MNPGEICSALHWAGTDYTDELLFCCYGKGSTSIMKISVNLCKSVSYFFILSLIGIVTIPSFSTPAPFISDITRTTNP